MRSAVSRWYWSRHQRLNRLEVVEKRSERFQRMEPSERRSMMGSLLLDRLKLFSQIEGAYPEWKELAASNDPEIVFREWSNLPIMGKDALRDRFPVSSIQARLHGQGTLNCTGGSTGEPTHFVHDPDMVKLGLSLQTQGWMRMGWKPGMRILCIWGAQRDIGAQLRGWPALKRAVSNRLYGFKLVDGFEITREKARAAHAWLERHGPACVFGYTSLLDYVARTMEEGGIHVTPGKVFRAWNGGEVLTPEQSERFQRVFHAPLLNYYAGRELGPLAYQIDPGGPLLIPRPAVHLELLDASGRPAEPGTMARVVVSSLLAGGTPFLRYEIGDLAVARPEYQDAAGWFALDRVEGRISSLLSIGGHTISNIYWNHLLKEFPTVHQFQVMALRDGGLRLSLIGKGFEPSEEANLRNTLYTFLGSVPVELRWVERLPLTPTGKLIQVLHEKE